jgi:outer membrane protein insertion porin family
MIYRQTVLKMTNKHLYFYLLVIMLIAYGCSNTKYLPEGEMLYVGSKVTVNDSLMKKKERKAMAGELEKLLRPKPNSNVLGLRFKLYIYNLAGEPKKEKGIKYWLRNKVGEPPVLFSQVDLDYNAAVLQSYSENKGYFKTRTSADSTSSNRRAKALYTLTPGKQYKIRNVTFPVDSTGTKSDSVSLKLEKAIANTKRRSLLKPGAAYDLDVIKAERDRIDNRLKNKGFFYFNPDNLLIRVDSTIGDNLVDLKVIVKNETPQKNKKIYTIDDIYIYPNFSLTTAKDTLQDKSTAQRYKDFKIIDPENTFRPIIYDRTLFFHKGDIYSRRDHNLSLNRLVNLGTFKFVKNEFRPSDSLSSALDVYYYFTPQTRKSIRAEILAKTNSANYNGTEINVNWLNRNTFRAAELLTITAFGGVEIQASGQNKGYNVYRVGTEASLMWPRFITPIKIKDSSAFVPRTKALLRYEYQNRAKLYSLNSLRAQFGYLWKDNPRVEHQLNITDINYVSPANVTDEYKIQIDSIPALQRVIDKQLIFGPTYTYTYTNTMQTRKKNTFYYKGSFDVSATVAGRILNGGSSEEDQKTILGVPYSEFVKMEHDFRHYFKLSRNSQIASRVIAGVGVPYGNSNELPYLRQFFIGGTNSIRAFRARSIGPGSYRDPEQDTKKFLPDQSGDIKLEMNTEYRAKLFSVVQGAVFVDAGNIWLFNKDEDRPGAEFSKKFFSELAVGTGAGLRFDLSFLVLRLDVAFPLRKPWLAEGDRWVVDDIDFGGKYWRKDNLVFNIAIGYPF